MGEGLLLKPLESRLAESFLRTFDASKDAGKGASDSIEQGVIARW